MKKSITLFKYIKLLSYLKNLQGLKALESLLDIFYLLYIANLSCKKTSKTRGMRVKKVKKREYYGFTSKELDEETNLYYFGARYYDAQISKWISPDPAINEYLDTTAGEGGKFNPINLNLYHYAGNNPLIFIDPTGFFTAKNRTPTAAGLSGEVWYTIKPFRHSYSYQDRFDQLSFGFFGSGIARSNTLSELTFNFIGEALNSFFAAIGSTGLGTFPDMAKDLFSSILVAAVTEGIDNINNYEDFCDNLMGMTAEDYYSFKADVENEFMKEFYKAFRSEYLMEITDEGQLNVSMLSKNFTDEKFISDFINFRKEKIEKGKTDYLIVDIPKLFLKKYNQNNSQ